MLCAPMSTASRLTGYEAVIKDDSSWALFLDLSHKALNHCPDLCL